MNQQSSPNDSPLWQKQIPEEILGLMLPDGKDGLFFYLKRYIEVEKNSSNTCSVYGCNNPTFQNSKFCEDHKCLLCNNLRSNMYCQYCQRCKCSQYNCKYARVDGFKYCEDHKCAISGCPNCTFRGSNYCRDHLAILGRLGRL